MIEKIALTPDLAAKLIAKSHPDQRKVNKPAVSRYARLMKLGRWRDYVPDPILVDHKTGLMFNGLQRCTAVVETGISIKVLIDYQADASLFTVIDGGLARKPHQFVKGARAAIRASAARVMLWYREDFDHPLGGASNYLFSTTDIVKEAERCAERFDFYLPYATGIYERTGLSNGVILAALTIADEMALGEEATDFASKIIEPQYLEPEDPAWRLVDRQSKHVHRIRHRQPMEDWITFVRHLNAALTGDPVPSKFTGITLVWPAIGETESYYLRRAARIRAIKSRQARERNAVTRGRSSAEFMAAAAQ